MRFYELNSSAWDKCVGEGLRMSMKNAKTKHVKNVRTLVGVCVPFAPKEWCQHGTESSMKEEENNLEATIETACQQEHS